MLEALMNAHRGEMAHIVGKGPSLLHLTADHFGPGPVLTLNQAVLAVQSLRLENPVYSLQNDGVVVGVAAGVTLLTNGSCPYEGSPHLEWDAVALGLGGPCAMVGLVAIEVAKLMGCRGIRLLCCDSLTTGDLRTVTHTSEDEYRVAYEDDGPPLAPSSDTYRIGAASMLRALESINYELVTA